MSAGQRGEGQHCDAAAVYCAGLLAGFAGAHLPTVIWCLILSRVGRTSLSAHPASPPPAIPCRAVLGALRSAKAWGRVPGVHRWLREDGVPLSNVLATLLLTCYAGSGSAKAAELVLLELRAGGLWLGGHEAVGGWGRLVGRLFVMLHLFGAMPSLALQLHLRQANLRGWQRCCC